MKEKNTGKLQGVMEQGYGIIPKKMMRDKEMSIEAKAIYAYLSSYTGAGSTAYPSIDLMCNDLNISVKRFYKHRKALIDRDYIRIERHRTGKSWDNNIYTIVAIPNEQCDENPHTEDLYSQNEQRQNDQRQNDQEQNDHTINNSIINNSITNNNINKKTLSSKPDRVQQSSYPYEKIISYLNEKADRSFKHTTGKTQNLIKARYKEGFTLDDFKAVIDAKTADWLHNESMNRYLRPETLFGTKFESYLNEKGGAAYVTEYDNIF